MRTPDDGLPPQGAMDEREDGIAADMEVAARITNAETREPWEVYNERENKTGVYYVINAQSKGGLIIPVTVKHSTRFDTFVCFTCNTHNTCKHARFVKKHVNNSTRKTA